MTVDVWQFYETLSDETRQNLSEAQRAVAAICDWRQEVSSGGFDSYFRYWGGNTAATAVAALPEALGSEWAGLLREGVALFGPEYPTEPDRRGAVLDGLDLEDRLEQMDARFFELEAALDADARLGEFLARDGLT